MAFRNYHAFARRPLFNKEGFSTSALFGSTQFLLRLIREQKPDYLIAASDLSGKTFRHDIYPDYKANRKEMPEDLAQQIPVLYDLLKTMGIPIVTYEKAEADDVIGTYVRVA